MANNIKLENIIRAKPVKLPDGNWGIETVRPVVIGDLVEIESRPRFNDTTGYYISKTWSARVRILVPADDAGEKVNFLCETEPLDKETVTAIVDAKNANSAKPAKTTTRKAAKS